jgi:rRNA maturation endonuclease Nob1
MNPMDRTNCIDCGESLPPSLPCTGCGSPVAADAKFCAVCGKPQK